MPRKPTPPVIIDDENPEWTEADFAKARPVSEHPQLAAALSAAKAKRGRPAGSGDKQQVTLRIDAAVLDRYRATGPGWQTRMNDALREASERLAG